MIKKLLTFLTVLALLIATGCSAETIIPKETPEDPEIATIMEAHPDVYLPLDTNWGRTLYSGQVEQHELTIPEGKTLFLANTKAFMEENEWTLIEEGENVLRFTKGDFRATYSLKASSDELETDLTLFIEPLSLFEDKEEEES